MMRWVLLGGACELAIVGLLVGFIGDWSRGGTILAAAALLALIGLADVIAGPKDGRP